MTDLIDFARETLCRHGALCEAPAGANDVLEAVLPVELAGRLGVGEHTLLHTSPAEGDPHLAYGSQILERLLGVACERPIAAAATVHPNALRGGDLTAAALDAFSARNGVLRPAEEGGAFVEWAAYVVLDYRVQADADERHEALLRVALAERDGTEVPRLVELCDALELEPGAPVLPSPLDPRLLLTHGARVAARNVTALLDPMRQSVRRRHLRDRARLRGYFEALRVEMLAQLERRTGASAEEIATRQAKIAGLDGELGRKLADLGGRYRIVARIEPVAALRLAVRVVRVPLRARRRKGERAIEVTWSSATRAFDPLGCQACSSPTWRFALCDQRLHVLCPACDDHRGLRSSCPICRS